jgi:cell division transport system permease protein
VQSLFFAAQEALQNMVKNLGVSVASVTTSAMSLLVLGIFVALSLNVSHLSQVLESEVGARVFLSDRCTAACITRVGTELRRLPDVRSVRYVSKGQALARLEVDFGSEGKALASLGSQNPLQNSYEIRVSDPARIPAVARRAARLRGVADVSYQAQVVDRLVSFIAVVRAVGLVVGLVLALGALLVIYNAIRVGLYARRREIAIMRLVGATEGFVRLPFLLEGVVLGLVGGGVAFLGLRLGYQIFFQTAVRLLPFLPVVPPGAVSGELAFLLLLFGVLLGFVGSRLSLRRARL